MEEAERRLLLQVGPTYGQFRGRASRISEQFTDCCIVSSVEHCCVRRGETNGNILRGEPPGPQEIRWDTEYTYLRGLSTLNL